MKEAKVTRYELNRVGKPLNTIKDLPVAPIQNERIKKILAQTLVNMESEDPRESNWEFFDGAKVLHCRIRFLQALLKILQPQQTLEFGSGTTTLAFARWSKAHYAFENHENYKQRTDDRLKEFDLHAAVLHVPLDLEVGTYKFDPRAIPTDLDLVLIDGPNFFEAKRTGTLPSILPHLSDQAIVLLDSAERSKEQKCLVEWYEELGIKFERPPEIFGMAVIDPWGHEE